MPRKVKTAFDGTDGDRAITGIHDIAFLARERDGVKRLRDARRRRHVDHAAHRADAVGLRHGRRRGVPEDRRGRASASSTARTGCASTVPAPASRCSSTRSASTRSAAMVDEELQGDWVAERDFAPDLFIHDESEFAPPAAGVHLQPERRPHGVRPLRAGQRRAAEAAGLLGRHREDHARRPDARAVPRPRSDHARVHRRLRPHDRAAEPRRCAGSATRRSTTSGSACGRSTSARPAPTRSPTSSAARAPTAASSASPARWASTRPSRSASRRWRSRIRSRAASTSR